jgi:glycosyltransferase involved in cell wall biosynthesis
MTRAHSAPRRVPVSVVITTYNHAHFLDEALTSVFGQTRTPADVIVVDDGSTDRPQDVLSAWPGVRLIRQDNRGLAAARNTGLNASISEYVLFLDADDLLAPSAIAAGLDCFERSPDAGFVYGAHRRIDVNRHPVGGFVYHPIHGDAFAAFLEGNLVGMHGAVLYRRDVLVQAGGFDEELSLCEDYDVYLRISRRHPVASHSTEIALYRWHGTNMSSDPRSMLRAALHVLGANRPDRTDTPERREAWRRGRRAWRNWYEGEAFQSAITSGRSLMAAGLLAASVSPVSALRHGVRGALQTAKRRLPVPVARTASRVLHIGDPRGFGRVRLGDLDSTAPVSLDFGWDRGQPVDRYYIESFLAAHAADVKGHVLEVGDDSYSKRFGGERVLEQDVLHVRKGHPGATITGDIAEPGVLPSSAFDCIVVTQTLHLVYDMRAAMENLHAALKPGGVLLLTVPGICQIDRGEWAESWYWALMPAAVRRLIADAFGVAPVEVIADGNVYAATSFLQGLALEEIDRDKLDYRDPAYPIVVSARAEKVSSG